MNEAVRVLNLGCGHRPLPAKPGQEVANHHLTKHRPEIAVTHDLNDLPWPWDDNSFDYIEASAVLEHLRITLIESLGECWRILRPEGLLHLKVPYWQHDNAFADPTHYWHFSLRTFDYFDPDTKLGRQYGFYRGSRPWKIVKPTTLNRGGSSIIASLRVRK